MTRLRTSIALAEAAAKGLGKALRHQLAASLRKYSERGQGGALKGTGISVPSQHMRSFIGYLNQVNCTGAVIVVDGKAAYYSVVREWLFGCEAEVTPDKLQELFHELQPNPEWQQELIAMTLGPGLLEQAGVHEGLRQFLRTALRNTWFIMDTDSGDKV